jgi:hypothetical protein
MGLIKINWWDEEERQIAVLYYGFVAFVVWIFMASSDHPWKVMTVMACSYFGMLAWDIIWTAFLNWHREN